MAGGDWWAKMPAAVLTNSELSDFAVRVYALLQLHADSNNRCWPGQDRLANMSGRSERTVRRALTELETANLIQSIRSGRGKTNKYEIMTGQNWPIKQGMTGQTWPVLTGQKWPVPSEVDPREQKPPKAPLEGGQKEKKKRRRKRTLQSIVEQPFVPGLYFDDETGEFTHKDKKETTA